MGFRTLNIGLLTYVFLSFSCFHLYGATFYVSPTGSNGNNGSLNSPWATIQFAVNSVYPGDTVLVRAGNYPEDVTLNFSGTAANPIVIRNYPTEYASLNPGSFYGWRISHVRLEGFHILRTVGETPGIEFNGNGGFVDIVGNEVTGLNATNTAAIRIGGFMHDFRIDGNHVHNNNTGNQEAIRVQNLTQDFEVVNNVVHDNVNIGIDIVGSVQFGKPKRGLVSRNLVYHNTTLAPYAAGIYIDEADSIILEYNTSIDNGYGFQIACEEPTGEARGNIMRYNIAIDNDERGLNIGGFTGGEVYGCQVYNNVFVNSGIGIHFSTNPGHDNVLVNNIVYAPAHTALKFLAAAPLNTVIDYNCYFTFDGLKPGTNSILADPLFVDVQNKDFRLQMGSPCIDAGDPISVGQLDFDSVAVPLDGNQDLVFEVDMGAFEYFSPLTGLGEPGPEGSPTVFPTPNTGAFYVDLRGSGWTGVQFWLFDAAGELVWREAGDVGDGLRLLRPGELQAGVYCLIIAGDSGTSAVRVSIVRD